MKKLIWLSGLVISMFLLNSCDQNRVYEHYEKIPDYKWDLDHKLRFEVEITDTLNMHHIFINVRNTGAYAYSNLWLFINQVSPDGQVKMEKLDCILATDNGEWYGSGFGNIFDLQIPFKQDVKFEKPGVYVFELIQGMRVPQLSEVVNVGIRIEKSKEQYK